MNEERLSRRSIIAIVAAGVITGVVALLATMFAVGNVQPTYQSTGMVAMVVVKTGLTADETSKYASILDGGQATKVAAAIYKQPRFIQEGARAAGVAPADLQVTTAAVDQSPLVTITVTGPTANAADAAAKAIITTGSPVVQQVAGKYDLPVLQDPVGTAAPANVSASQLLIVAFIGGLLVGSGAALIIVRARSRSDEEPAYVDSGEFRAVPGGYGPPPGRPMPGPSNGGAPPRRPTPDPRAQRPQPPR